MSESLLREYISACLGYDDNLLRGWIRQTLTCEGYMVPDFSNRASMEDWLEELGPDDEVNQDVIDPEPPYDIVIYAGDTPQGAGLVTGDEDPGALESLPEPPYDLRAAVQQVLENPPGDMNFEIEEEGRDRHEVYARFASSDARDADMISLGDVIEDEVKKFYPEANFEDKKKSAHSRKVLRISDKGDHDKYIDVVFKGPSGGGEGLNFETALFAVLKAGHGGVIVDKKLSTTEKKNLEKKLGIPVKSLGDDAAIVDYMTDQLADKTSGFYTDKKMAGPVKRALAAVSDINANLGKVSAVDHTGGGGGKGDLVITAAKPGGQPVEIDLSLKLEKKTGTNNFIYNKDVGDGTTTVDLGRDAPGLKRFNMNLIPAPGNKPWWQIGRKDIVDALKKDPDYTDANGNLKDLSSQDEKDFYTQADPGSLMAIKKLFDQDKKKNKGNSGASAVPAATMIKAMAEFKKNLQNLSAMQVLSIIEESLFGASSVNDLWKITTSPQGTQVKKTQPSNAMSAIDSGTLVPKDLQVVVGNVMGARGPRADLEVKLIDNNTGNVVATLQISGLKFRSSIFSTGLSDLKIKTRA